MMSQIICSAPIHTYHLGMLCCLTPLDSHSSCFMLVNLVHPHLNQLQFVATWSFCATLCFDCFFKKIKKNLELLLHSLWYLHGLKTIHNLWSKLCCESLFLKITFFLACCDLCVGLNTNCDLWMEFFYVNFYMNFVFLSFIVFYAWLNTNCDL